MAYTPPSVNYGLAFPGSGGLVSSFVDITITSTSSLNPGSPNGGTLYDGWCLNETLNISIGTHTAAVYSSYELGLLSANNVLSATAIANLDNVNWLANKYESGGFAGLGYTYGDIQAAIWTLEGNDYTRSPNLGSYTVANVNTLVSQAQTTGEGFVPGAGDYIGMILDTRDGAIVNGVPSQSQPIIIETKSASLGDFVWEDKNFNGIQDSGEGGIAGVKVNLWRDLNANGVIDTGEIVASTTTDANGKYAFNGLAPGLSYQVQFVQPTGFDGVSPVNAPGSTIANDSNGLISAPVTLAPGENNTTIDSGFYHKPTLAHFGDFIWFDKNANGIQDAGETGVAGVQVNAVNTVTNQTYTTTTDANGIYGFDVTPGTYTVLFSNGGYINSPSFQGTDTTKDSNFTLVAAGTSSATVTVNAGDNNLTIDAGLYKLAHLGDFVWNDLNANGIQDANEPGIAGVEVDLKDTTGTVIATTVTNASGIYGFDVKPGTYAVAVVDPTGFKNTVANAGTDDTKDSDFNFALFRNGAPVSQSGSYTVAAGDNNLTIDAGYYKLASLGDFVWIDANKNGIQDTGEVGAIGVTVSLLNAGGNVQATQLTDATGHYLFTGLIPGSYSVQFAAPSGYGFTTQDANSNTQDTVDSDANPATGKTGSYTLNSGDVNLTVDAGLVSLAPPPKGSIGDFVWYDKNHNGIQDAGEAGIAGVKLDLYKDSANNVLVGTTTTDANGKYLFTGLDAGTYHVDVQEGTLPAGYVFTVPLAGADRTVDSNVSTRGGTIPLNWGVMDTVALAQGQNDLTQDAGAYKIGIDVQKYVSSCSTTTTTNCGGEGANSSWWKSNCGSTQTWVSGGLFGMFGSWVTTMTGWANVTQCKATDSFNTIFGCNAVNGTKSIYDCLNSTATDAHSVFMKESCAAYLNACNTKVSYQYSTAQVCAQVQYCESKADYTATCESFKTQNNLGCSFTTSKCTVATTCDATLYDADAPPGLQVKTGSTVTFTYIVKNTGDTALGTVKLTDDRITNVKYVSGDTNNNGLLDTNETWTYTAQEVAASGTIKNIGTVTAVDPLSGGSVTASDPAYYTGTGVTSCTPGTTKCSTGGLVWCDNNVNGYKDGSDACLAGIKVKLTCAGADGIFGTKDDIVCNTVTDSKGSYQFCDIDPGKCKVTVDNSAGYSCTKQVTQSGSLCSTLTTTDCSTGVFTLNAGENNLGVNCGVYKTAAYTPIVINLDGHGIETTALTDSTGTFDLLGNGHALNSGWITSGSAFLAVDSNGNGKIDDLSELFGGTAKGAGFAQLATYDTNHDGVIDAKDADFGKLLVWQDLNGDHQSSANELMTLAQAGIASLSLSTVDGSGVDAQGNLMGETSSATLSSGASVAMTDVYFAVSGTDDALAGTTLPTMADLLGSATLDALVGPAAASATTVDALVGPAAPAATQVAAADDAHTDQVTVSDAGEVLRRIFAVTNDHIAALHAVP